MRLWDFYILPIVTLAFIPFLGGFGEQWVTLSQEHALAQEIHLGSSVHFSS